MRIDIELAYTFINNKQIKSLAFALLIKDTYQSSMVHNYTINALRDKLKAKGYTFHHSTIKKYIKTLHSYGLIKIQGNNLIITKLYSDYRNTINIKKARVSEFKTYIHFIRAGILKNKYFKAKFIQSKLELSNNKGKDPKSYKDLKISKGIKDKFNNYSIDERGFNYKQSILSMAKEFNCSVMELYTTINYLVKKGYLKIANNISKLCDYIGGSIPECCFIYNGGVYKAECNYYSFPLIDSSK